MTAPRYTQHSKPKARRVCIAMIVAGTLAGGGMWAIAQAFAGAAGYSFMPLEAIPFGMLAVGAGHYLSYATARSLHRYDTTRTYEPLENTNA